jgi:hypothetical protein
MNTDYRMLAKGLQFKSLKETNHFCTCQTHLKQEYVKAVKDDIVIIGKEQETYYYDEKTKLWNCCTREVWIIHSRFLRTIRKESDVSVQEIY